MIKEVLTFNFEISEPDFFKPKNGFKDIVDIKKVKHDQYLNFVLFLGVGLPYAWGERLLWEKEQWASFLSNKEVFFYLGFADNSLVGYFEMHRHNNSEMEIKYFGLLPEFTGKGLGGALLSHAVNEAHQLGAKKVWLHTCEFDAKIAVKNYTARGFKKVKEYYSSEYVPSQEESLKRITEFFKNFLKENTF